MLGQTGKHDCVFFEHIWTDLAPCDPVAGDFPGCIPFVVRRTCGVVATGADDFPPDVVDVLPVDDPNDPRRIVTCADDQRFLVISASAVCRFNSCRAMRVPMTWAAFVNVPFFSITLSWSSKSRSSSWPSSYQSGSVMFVDRSSSSLISACVYKSSAE